MILLDTGVVSEALKPNPDANVVAWLNNNFPNCALSSISIFELNAGACMLPEGRRRQMLEAAIARTLRRFGPRLYGFDAPSAIAAAKLFARARAQGEGPHQMPAKLADVQIGGIAAAYGLDLATRNLTDFRNMGLALIDPWTI